MMAMWVYKKIFGGKKNHFTDTHKNKHFRDQTRPRRSNGRRHFLVGPYHDEYHRCYPISDNDEISWTHGPNVTSSSYDPRGEPCRGQARPSGHEGTCLKRRTAEQDLIQESYETSNEWHCDHVNFKINTVWSVRLVSGELMRITS